MPELRLVLIIVGVLAIAALLFHGLWTNKKEGKRKFAEQSVNKNEGVGAISDDGFEVIKKERPKSTLGIDRNFSHDPLGIDTPTDFSNSDKNPSISRVRDASPKISLPDDVEEPLEDKVIFADNDDLVVLNPEQTVEQSTPAAMEDPMIHSASVAENNSVEQPSSFVEAEEKKEPQDTLEVIILHVHCVGDEPFVGTKLFDSMQQNGLLYGEMDIFHRHNDMSGTGKVLFSVANMMQPGTLRHDNPETFTTKGISFFMTLPCFGEAEQNFKLMLKTAQQIADDLGANVLDDQHNLMTPDKLAHYRNQIRSFNARQTG